MTALAAVYGCRDEDGPKQRCERVLAAQSGYGTGRSVSRTMGKVAIGRRLTPLLDEDVGDSGPAADGQGRLLAADIRIDNRGELLAALELSGGVSARLPDAGLLLRCWDRWGEAALGRVVGDFAFVLWDAPAQRLLLARDPMGQRPLCFHRAADFLAVASMPRGLHALAEVPYALDEQALRRFLDYSPEDASRTFFEGIEQVPPGHVVEVRPGEARSRAFWVPDLTPIRFARDEDYVERGRELLDAAVAARLRGVGPVIGAHLSAGLDSAGIAATAARLLAGSGRVVGFTAVPPPDFPGQAPNGRILDEGPGAAATASLYSNIDHVLVRSASPSPLAELERSFQLFQRPLPNPCNYGWGSAIQEAAKARNIQVMLTGQMGNLSFSHSGIDRLPQLLRSGRLLATARVAAALRAQGMPPLEVASSAIGPLLPRSLWARLQRLRGRPARREDFTFGAAEHADPRATPDYAHQPVIFDAAARWRTLSSFDFGNFNKGILAGWGIDMRDPTADRRLVEYSLRVPAEQFLRNGERRSLARRMLADRLPASIVNSQMRGYQCADWQAALGGARQDIEAEAARISTSNSASRHLEMDRLRRLIEDWPSDWSSPDKERLYRGALLRSLSAGHFARKVEGSNA